MQTDTEILNKIEGNELVASWIASSLFNKDDFWRKRPDVYLQLKRAFQAAVVAKIVQAGYDFESAAFMAERESMFEFRQSSWRSDYEEFLSTSNATPVLAREAIDVEEIARIWSNMVVPWVDLWREMTGNGGSNEQC